MQRAHIHLPRNIYPFPLANRIRLASIERWAQWTKQEHTPYTQKCTRRTLGPLRVYGSVSCSKPVCTWPSIRLTVVRFNASNGFACKFTWHLLLRISTIWKSNACVSRLEFTSSYCTIQSLCFCFPLSCRRVCTTLYAHTEHNRTVKYLAWMQKTTTDDLTHVYWS